MLFIHWLPTIFSILATIFAGFAGKKAADAAKVHQLTYPQYPSKSKGRRRFGARLFGAGPNDAAGPADIANKFDGIDGATGGALPFRMAAMLYTARMFGLGKDYAFPENANVSASLGDQTNTLAKLLTRTRKMSDGNEYTLWDAVMTQCKATVLANPHINDDEPNSVNYRKPAGI